MPRPLVYPDDEQVVELRADCVTRAFSPSSLVMNQHAGSSTALPAAEATQCWPMASVAAEVWAFIAEGSAFGARPVEGLVGKDWVLDCTAAEVEGCTIAGVEGCIVAKVRCTAIGAGSSKGFDLGRLAFESGLESHERSCALLPDGRCQARGCSDHSEGCPRPCGRSP